MTFKNLLLVLQAFFLLVIVRFALSTLGIKKVIFGLAKKKAMVLTESSSVSAKIILRASLFVPKCSCFVQAIVFKMIMSCNSKLVIGVAREPNFSSHAWIEQSGEVIFGEVSNLKHYVPIMEIS